MAERAKTGTKAHFSREPIQPIVSLERGKTQYYKPNEVAKRLGLSDQTIRRMCENGKFKEAFKTDGGHWRIPEDDFVATRKQDRKAEQVLEHIDMKNNEVGDIDEFDL